MRHINLEEKSFGFFDLTITNDTSVLYTASNIPLQSAFRIAEEKLKKKDRKEKKELRAG